MDNCTSCEVGKTNTERIVRLEERADKFEARLSKGEVNFAIIQQDLGYIKARLDDKKKFNSQTAASIIQAASAILLAWAATKMGIG